MSKSSYKARYTSNGYSIKLLKEKAKLTQEKTGCKRYQALNEVARQHGFANWNEIVQQQASPSADLFFENFYNDPETIEDFKDSYEEFLISGDKVDNPESWREFASQHYQTHKRLNFDNLHYIYKRPTLNAFLKALKDHTDLESALVLLPQNLSSFILESLLQGFEHGRALEQAQAAPFLDLDDISEDEGDSLVLFEGIIKCVMLLNVYKIEENSAALPLEKFHEMCNVYYTRLKLEWVSRRTKMKFEEPTIENIFSAESDVIYRFY